MKRLTALLAFILILSFALASCGGSSAGEKDTAETKAAETKALEKDTDATGETKAPENGTDPKPLENADIANARPFSDGVAFVEYADGTAAAIDTKGNRLFALDGDTFKFSSTETRSYKDGYIVIGNNIFDKTGKKIEYEKPKGFESLLTDSAGGYMLARGTDNGASGLGILRTDGTWISPISADNKLVQKYNEMNVRLSSLKFTDGFDYYGGALVRVNVDWTTRFYYDLEKDVFTDDYVHFETVDGEGIYKYDVNGESSLLIPGKGELDGGIFDGLIFCSDLENDTHVYIYDYDGNLVGDLGDKIVYSVKSFIGEENVFFYDGELILATLYTEEGPKYAVLDRKGEIKRESGLIGDHDTVCAFVDGEVYYYSYEQGCIYKAGADGNRTESGAIGGFFGYGDGLLLIKNEFDQLYYIDASLNPVIK